MCARARVQVVCPRYNSLYKSLRHDLQLTCLVLTVAIYSCSLAVITWPTDHPVDCRRAASHYSDADQARIPWTGRSFNDDISSSVTRDIVTPVRVPKCQPGSTGNVVSTLTLTWCSLIAVIYLVYVVECWFSPCRRRFSDKHCRVVDTQAAYDLVTSLQNSLPVVRWTAVSYHYIRSTVASVSMTSPLHHHKPYRQRVITRRDASMYHYAPDDLLDCSAPLVGLEAFPVTWLRVSTQFSFASTTARRDFARQRDAFYRANRRSDQHVDFRQTISLLATSGAHIAWSRDMAVYNPDVRPWYTTVAVYWLASLLTLSWPLRIIHQWRTATADYSVHKVFSCHATDSDVISRGYDDVISVTSLENSSNSSSSSSSSCTINSNSISSDAGSMPVDTDFALVPSYSQAILMDRTNDNCKTYRHHHHQQQQYQQCQHCQHCQQCQQWRRGCYSSRLRRVQSCVTVQRDFTNDVKPSQSLTTHLYKRAARHNRAAILMTSRPPSYDTAMCFAGHVTTHRLTPCHDDIGYGGTATQIS